MLVVMTVNEGRGFFQFTAVISCYEIDIAPMTSKNSRCRQGNSSN